MLVGNSDQKFKCAAGEDVLAYGSCTGIRTDFNEKNTEDYQAPNHPPGEYATREYYCTILGRVCPHLIDRTERILVANIHSQI